MFQIRVFSTWFALWGLTAAAVTGLTADAQTPTPSPAKLSLRAAVVLTPEFCATKIKKGQWLTNQETFLVGAAACADIEPALKAVFTSLVRVASSDVTGDAQVTLAPRFVDVNATQRAFAFSNRELIVAVEWTVKDTAGKTIWVGTVQGSATHHIGNSFTYKKNLNRIVEDSSKEMAAQSANIMASSPELLALAKSNSGSGE
jgi:hypothetical protein